MSDDNSPDDGLSSLGSLVPGSELEKAAAGVGREAGKSIVRGIANLFGAGFAKWIAQNEATAEAARLAIETQAAIDRSRVLTAEHRKQQLEEIDHHAVKLLAEQRLKRLVVEMAREQANFEAIATRSLQLIEHDPQSDNARDIDDDWMFKFARYAQDVSDKQIQELWARILSSAAIEGAQRLSPAALQTVSLIDGASATDFEKFCSVIATFEVYPAHRAPLEHEAQNINLGNLVELGLIVERNLTRYSFQDFDVLFGPADNKIKMSFSHPHFVLTQRGVQIASVVFGSKEMTLADDLQENYIRDIISSGMQNPYPLNIAPKIGNKFASFAAQVDKKPNATLPITTFEIPQEKELSGRVRRLIAWANERYLVSFHPNPSR
jgi:hypothetical protein